MPPVITVSRQLGAGAASVMQYDHVFMKVDWADPLLYHLILNTGRMRDKEVANLLVARIRAAEVAP